jgi:hypothetical protein
MGGIIRGLPLPGGRLAGVGTASGKRTTMIILIVLAAVVVGAPIAAAILVSLASLREDAKHSLAGRAPGPMARAARRLLRVQPRGVVLRRSPRLPRPRVPADDDMSKRLTGPYV